MMRYVTGILFSDDKSIVVMCGQGPKSWALVSGHVHDHEPMQRTMSRTFYEQTSVMVEADQWESFLLLQKWQSGQGDAQVHFFKAFNTSACMRVVGAKGLAVQRMRVDNLHRTAMSAELRWILPMALHADQTNVKLYVVREAVGR